jgi:cysteinyl-tRNA synthetase
MKKPTIKIYNTLTRKKDLLVPIKGKKINLFVCGPTVYDFSHIGHARTYVMFDCFSKYLKQSGFNVSYLQNITDVDDKIIQRAREKGVSAKDLAVAFEKEYLKDMKALGVTSVNKYARATSHIKEIISQVERLLKKGYAYKLADGIYFDISKFPPYNELNRQKIEENREGAGAGHVSDPEKRHQEDFALWFFKTGVHKNALQTWKSPFHSPDVKKGDGFPGWHIECSAMIRKFLGKTIDIHMGGIEHIPVHHTNEIAQSESANGVKFVDYWLHNEHLTVDGKKMAKSEGTAYSLADIKQKGFHPLDLRLLFIQAHYRSKQNFTWEALEAARTTRKNIEEKIAALLPAVKKLNTRSIDEQFAEKFNAALENDFNIPEAFALVPEILKSSLTAEEKIATILDFDTVFGLELAEIKPKESHISTTPEIEQLLQEREKARKKKNWTQSDALRDELLKKYGLHVEDTANGQELRK